MRQIVLDTETTGLEPSQGHRIIELGCVELVNRRLTGRHFQRYLRPDRAIDSGALEVHGITEEFLRDKPRFGDVVDDLLAFLDGAELIIHNADFDIAFLDHELAMLGGSHRPVGAHCAILDTLSLARQLHPGQRNSLDALCKRYGVDNSQRTLHGALLDAEILADVYLAMTGGQATLDLDAASTPGPGGDAVVRAAGPRSRPALRVLRATAEEAAAHEERLAAIDSASGGGCVWRRAPAP